MFIRNLLGKNNRFFSQTLREQKILTVAEQIEARKSDPAFLKHLKEIKDKLNELKLNPKKYHFIKTHSIEADKEAAIAKERKNRMHSVY